MIILLFAFLFVLAFPSSDYSIFNGVPFSSLAEYFLFVFSLVVLFSSRGRRRLGERLAPAPRRVFFVAGLAIVFAAKVALLASHTSEGFHACYQAMPLGEMADGRRTASPAIDKPCEASFENLFGFFDVTRVDSYIDFDRSWKLGFWNSGRSSSPSTKGQFLPERLPFEATWTGTVRSDHPVALAYVGEGSVTVDGTTFTLEKQVANAAKILLPAMPKPTAIAVRYTWNDDYRNGDEKPPGPNAMIRLFDSETNSALGPVAAPLGWKLLARAADFFVLAAAALFAFVILRETAGERLIVCVALALAGATSLELSSPLALAFAGAIPFIVLLAAVVLRKRAPNGIALSLACVAISFIHVVARSAWNIGDISLRSAGDDWQTYEAMARSILEKSSLRGGEDVFFYQPLFRYYRFLEHLFFGEGDTLILVSALAALGFGVVWLFAHLVPINRTLSARSIFALSAAAIFALLNLPVVIWQVDVGLSEYPTWIFMPVIMYLFFVRKTRAASLLAALLLGVSLFTRTNQAPALLAIFAIASFERWRTDRVAVVWAAGVIASVAALILAHNFAYGGQFAILPTSGSTAGNLVVPPLALFAGGASGALWAKFVWQLSCVLYVGFVARQTELLVLCRAIQVTWLCSTLWLWSRPTVPMTRKLLMLLPLVYLSVHLFYQVDVYFPRHIIAGYIAMAIVTAFALHSIPVEIASATHSKRGANRTGHSAPRRTKTKRRRDKSSPQVPAR